MADRLASTAPVVLIIRDGWGRNPNRDQDEFNAVLLANTPVADQMEVQWPTVLIQTCGQQVGLPPGTMGNSEVGHQNIGAGRIVDQELLRITRTIRDGSFFTNKALCQSFSHAKKTGKNLHIIGLVSDGQVHSDIQHLFALIDMSVRQQLPAQQLLIHAITDGRDTGPQTGEGFIKALEEKLASTGIGRIASVIGRYFAMDRDNRWDRVAKAYNCLTGADPTCPTASTATDALQSYYNNPTEPNQAGDEFITPTYIVDTQTSEPLPRVAPGDAIIFFNFRGDRPREIIRAFMLDDAAWENVPNGGFDRGQPLSNLHFCAMTEYEKGLPVSDVAFYKPPKMPNILGEVIANAGLTQFRCAETEKYPHITFFFNDYREEPFDGEHWQLLPSPKDVSTYDQKPQMAACEVTDAVLERLAADDCEPLIVVNLANSDMVGHTGNLQATIKAVEVVDVCVGKIIDATLKRNGSLIITADHGNAEQMYNPENECPHTSHTVYDVPLSVVGEQYKGRTLRSGGRLADIAPTVLDMLGITKPVAMTGESLLQ